MLKFILTLSFSVFSFFVFHSAQEYDAPQWESPPEYPSAGEVVDQPQYYQQEFPQESPPEYQPELRSAYPEAPLSYQEPTDYGTADSPDFPQYPEMKSQDYPAPGAGSPLDDPDYNPPYSYDDEGPGLMRQGTSTTTICFCTPVGTCTNGSTNLGEGQIDPRVGGTTSQVASQSQQRPIVTTTTPARVTSCQSSALQLCCTPGPYQCGITWPAVRGSPSYQDGQARFGQYPWQVVLLTRNDTYLGSGALIDNSNVVTAAHKVTNYT